AARRHGPHRVSGRQHSRRVPAHGPAGRFAEPGGRQDLPWRSGCAFHRDRQALHYPRGGKVNSAIGRFTSFLLLLGFLNGCNVLGVAASAVAGGEEVKAQYQIPKRPTIVVAENFSNPSMTSLDDEPRARFVTDELNQHAIAPMIDPSKVYAIQNGSHS